MFEDLKFESKKIQFGLMENSIPNDVTPEELIPETPVEEKTEEGPDLPF